MLIELGPDGRPKLELSKLVRLVYEYGGPLCAHGTVARRAVERAVERARRNRGSEGFAKRPWRPWRLYRDTVSVLLKHVPGGISDPIELWAMYSFAGSLETALQNAVIAMRVVNVNPDGLLSPDSQYAGKLACGRWAVVVGGISNTREPLD